MPEEKIRVKKRPLSEEEKKLLIEIFEHSPKKVILSKFPDRSGPSIFQFAKKLGLKRDPEIIRRDLIPIREDTWTSQEIQIVTENYPNSLQSDLEKKLPGRTFRAIREMGRRLRLTRNKEMIDLDRDLKSKETLMKKYGVDCSLKIPAVEAKARQTTLDRLGVEYPTQCQSVRDKVKATVQERYGVDNVFQAEEIKKKMAQTNLKIFGFENPNQCPEIKKKSYETAKANNSFSESKEEFDFFNYLKLIDPQIEPHVRHPFINHIIDYYSYVYDLWIQYDGAYWHGKINRDKQSRHSAHIENTIKNDTYQNENIPNLIRFWSDDVEKEIQNNNILNFIKNKIENKLKKLNRTKDSSCHQHRKKMESYEQDLRNLNFDHQNLGASDFQYSKEDINSETINFIKKYEWLGTIGVNPKWCFTARYNGALGGVVLINEPTSYSKLLGEKTPQYEALIQRGASASWTPKNLGSKLIMFACTWVVKNTEKRAFVAYGDPKANEIGTIYQACNFDYIGDNFGNSFLYRHPEIKENRPFSNQSLKRTSMLKIWCRKNNITIEKNWLNRNGFKNLKIIPENIKLGWNSYCKRIISESEKIPIEKKHKYVLLLGTTKKEKKFLSSLKTYKSLPYPKRF